MTKIHMSPGKLLLASCIAASCAQANLAEPVAYPQAPELQQRPEIEQIQREQIWTFETLEQYWEPEFVSQQVEQGKLPQLADRLPEKPLVYQTGAMTDGPGEYGGVLRMVIGARPTGWNWAAGNTQGYGGVNRIIQECLTKTGSMYKVIEEDREPLPNLAKSWEWSEDGTELTMNLIRGAHWSDGEAFDADDLIFLWEDNILDPNVPALASANTFGEGTTFEKVDDYTVRWTFKDSFPVLNLFSMSSQFCPGPSHLLKAEHPKYNPENNYRDYINAFAPNKTPWVTLGAWSTVEYKPDEILVMRRNPYYWKVDENGTQLPYKNEVHIKLSEWTDRLVQTLADNADLANMDEPTALLDGVQRANAEESLVRVILGPRTQGWAMEVNFSETNGVTTEKEKAIRQLNRDLRFRRALTQALDREALGQALIRGPFTTIYPGGLMPESPYFDTESVVYYPYSPDSTRQLLAETGLKDLNNDGYVQWTEGNLAGESIELTIAYTTSSPTQVMLAENVMAMLDEAGIKTVARPLPHNSRDSIRFSGTYDFMVVYTDDSYIIPEGNLSYMAPISSSAPFWHVGATNLTDFELELVDIITEFRRTSDPVQRGELMKKYNHVFTSNIYNIGLSSVTGAAMVSSRLKNVNPALPMKGYAWAEESIIRERLWTPAGLQKQEIFENTLPES